MSGQMVGNAATSEAVAVGVGGTTHGQIGILVVEQLRHVAHDSIDIGAHEFHGASRHSLGAFGGIAHHQHGFPQAGRFFLNAPLSVSTTWARFIR